MTVELVMGVLLFNPHWCSCQRDTFLSAQYLMNCWLDSCQIFMDI